jgi:hypothetical protein
VPAEALKGPEAVSFRGLARAGYLTPDVRCPCASAGLLGSDEKARALLKPMCHRQRGPLIGFQSDLLGQHDVARDEMVLGYEAPAGPRSAAIV